MGRTGGRGVSQEPPEDDRVDHLILLGIVVIAFAIVGIIALVS